MTRTSPPSCSDCAKAHHYPEHRLFNPACLHCGARLIQRLGTMQISQTECRQRRQAMLALWIAHGHCETQLRTLANGPPSIGQAEPSACAPQPSAKTPYHPKK